MIKRPVYIDFLNVSYKIEISIKPKKNGNFGLAITLLIGSINDYYYNIRQNILKIFLDNWRHYFQTRGIMLMRRKNGAIYLDSVPQKFIDDILQLGFRRYKSRYIARKNNIEFRKTGNKITEINDLLFKIFKYDTLAEQTIQTNDLFDHV